MGDRSTRSRGTHAGRPPANHVVPEPARRPGRSPEPGRARPLIALRQLTKRYATGTGSVDVLRGVDMTINTGEFVAIMGQSGSGKTTLMNIVGALDGFDEGEYVFAGQDVRALDADALAALRGRHIGFVFQSFNLVARMSAARNVELPMIYTGVDAITRLERARASLVEVGLEDRIEHLPNQLSGGQQQRVAIARALVNDPELVVADEPTGSLDSTTGAAIMQLFERIHASGRTIVMVTHEDDIAAHASRVIRLHDGRVVSDSSS